MSKTITQLNIEDGKYTAGLASAIDELRELENLVPAGLRHRIDNHRAGVEMMYRDVRAIVEQVNANRAKIAARNK